MSVSFLQMAEIGLARHRPSRKWLKALGKRAAVALILQLREGELGVLMIRRSEREGDPWSGQMAFPGGRLEPSDDNGLAAARRETEEEIGLHLGTQEPCMGRLSELNAGKPSFRGGLVITPYVFHLKRAVNFHPNYEVAEVVWVPLEFLLDPDNREEMTWEFGGVRLRMPCYFFEERRIWGLSLRMLDELLDLIAGKSPKRPPWRRF
ncbi:MAG: 8-oxo-dGTP pyrophosphatase MutT (NUDIX family) [Halieaceae bacterium]